MVTAISSGGYQVRRFTREDIIDAIELRGIIEGAAALAAERGAPPVRLNALAEVLRKLDAVIAVYPGPMDFERYAAPNEQFHRMLVALSGSALIAREAERVTSLPFASPNAFVGAELNVPAFQQSLLVAQVQHRMMVQAITRRDGARRGNRTRACPCCAPEPRLCARRAARSATQGAGTGSDVWLAFPEPRMALQNAFPNTFREKRHALATDVAPLSIPPRPLRVVRACRLLVK